MKNVNNYFYMKVFLIIILLLQINFFDLIPFQQEGIWLNLNSSSNKYLILVLLVFAALIKPLTHIDAYKDYQFFRKSVALFCVIIVIVLALSAIKYEGGFVDAFLNGYSFFVFPLSYFVFGDYLLNVDFFKWFVKSSSVIAFIESLLYIINSRFLKILHPSAVVDINNVTSGNSFLGFVRYQTPADFIFFVSFLLTTSIAIKLFRIGLLFILTQIVLISYLLFVSQVRTYFALACIYIIVILIVKLATNSGALKAFVVLFSCGGTFALLYFMIEKLGFFDGDRISSFLVRTEAIPYYLSHMLDGKIYGMGFPSPIKYPELVHGYSQIYSASIFYIEDTGIFGILGVFGLLGVLFILYLIGGIIKAYKICSTKGIYIISLVFFMGLFPTVIPLNISRIIFMSFYLIILEFISMNSRIN